MATPTTVGKSDEQQAPVGYPTTLPLWAQCNNIDIRASHEQKHKEPFAHTHTHTPTLPPTAGMVVTTQNLQHKCITRPCTATTTSPCGRTPLQLPKLFISPQCAIRINQPKHIHALVGSKRHPMPSKDMSM